MQVRLTRLGRVTSSLCCHRLKEIILKSSRIYPGEKGKPRHAVASRFGDNNNDLFGLAFSVAKQLVRVHPKQGAGTVSPMNPSRIAQDQSGGSYGTKPNIAKN